MLTQIKNFLKLESASGILLLIFAFLAILLANSPLSSLYFQFLDMPVVVQVGTFAIYKPLLMWVNDGLMAIFFTLVGLEVKREMMVGSLSSYQKSIFPAVAAIGGMVVPAAVYLALTSGHDNLTSGWAIPMATDIAFALGVLALISKRVPPALKIFLLALAVIDDLGAIVVIALFYSHDMSILALTIAAVTIIALVILNRMGHGSISTYAIIGLGLWVAVLKSGVHATIAGVILGFCIPLQGKNGEKPLEHLEHTLAPWCSFVILPLFAFCNAGVSLFDVSLAEIVSPLPLGIMLGLLIGKPVGVFLFSYLAVLFKIAKLPDGVNFRQVFAVAVLCGIGFTMSMFLTSLAFGIDVHLTSLSRLGILIGSGLSAVIGYVLLSHFTKEKTQA